MSAKDFYQGINSPGRHDEQPFLVQIYVTADLLTAHQPEVVKKKLGEEAWTQAHALAAARTETN
jgi:hypothetical protein